MSRKILVIDDHPETVRLIELTLRRHGYEVSGAGSGTEGLAVAESEPPDLVLLDVMMPDMDGHTVCRKMREDDKLREVPVIMFSARSQVRDKKEGFDAGANDYLVKPTRPAELISRVEAMLTRRDEQPAAAEMEVQTPVHSEEPDREDGHKPPQVIAVMGARGGAGATIVALNLAVSLADQGQPTTLVDLDVQQGHIGVLLGADFYQGIDEWLQLPAGELEAALPNHLLEYDDRLELLLARPQPAHAPVLAPDVPFATALTILERRQRHLVFDLGRSRGDAVAPLFKRADHIIICLRPERAAITATRQLVEHLAPRLSNTQAIHALMVDSGQSDNLPRRAVEKYLGFPLFAVVTLYSQQIAEAVNRELPLVRARPSSPPALQFQKIAEQLAVAE
ncbi:MAG: response regulator, partial [Anaerolineae bacterium]|nr:response regulator [Anaerolineae bacterium]